MVNYARPEMLVETSWVVDNLNKPNLRLVESDEDILEYEKWHIPGAVRLDWFTDLQHPERRDFVTKEQFEKLMSDRGIGNETTIVFYGDKHNWFAVYSLWLCRYFGHDESKLKVMNGGRVKWQAENRPTTKEVPTVTIANYKAKEPNKNIRAFRDEVLASLGQSNRSLIDVRSPDEYSGKLLHMPGYPQEGAQRGGHIPSAFSIPWAQAVQPEDSTFKSAVELNSLYQKFGITPDKDVIAYCRIGERSAHTWFVLTYLLGYPKVKNYDGSWTEWGSMVNVPIKKGTEP
jgi:thiosulfate/3-mercaptopyruvate sulfurtransferase